MVLDGIMKSPIVQSTKQDQKNIKQAENKLDFYLKRIGFDAYPRR